MKWNRLGQYTTTLQRGLGAEPPARYCPLYWQVPLSDVRLGYCSVLCIFTIVFNVSNLVSYFSILTIFSIAQFKSWLGFLKCHIFNNVWKSILLLFHVFHLLFIPHPKPPLSQRVPFRLLGQGEGGQSKQVSNNLLLIHF